MGDAQMTPEHGGVGLSDDRIKFFADRLIEIERIKSAANLHYDSSDREDLASYAGEVVSLRAKLAAEHEARVAAEAAQALMVERAADEFAVHPAINAHFYADTPDQWRWRVYEHIMSLAPEAGVAELAKLRAERDEARLKLADKEQIYTSAIGQWAARAEIAEAEAATLRTRLAEAEGKVAALTEAGEQWKAAHIALRDAGTMPEPNFFDMWTERRRKEDALIAALAAVKEAEHG